jgi:hypothetical protein
MKNEKYKLPSRRYLLVCGERLTEKEIGREEEKGGEKERKKLE